MVKQAAAEPVLSQRELNRAVLARQLLLERASLPVARALERVAGLQMQYAPSGYVGLWTRLEGFERDDLTKALERRSAVQGTLMRTTIHLVSARDFRLFSVAVRDARREWWLKARRGKVDVRRLKASARKIEGLLAFSSISFARRRPARGNVAAPTSSRLPTSGSARRP